MNKENDYAYFSESLHSSYLFFTMEVDKLSKENKRLREALEAIKTKYEPYIAYLQVVEDINKIMTALKGGE